MPASAAPGARGTSRAHLSRDRVVAAAIDLADAGGVDAVSMRRLAAELGIDPMSVYRYVNGKDDLLEAMIDAVIARIEPVTDAGDWRANARATMLAARATMLRHPWTAQLRKVRSTPTPAELRHLDTLLGILRDGGLDLALVHHAIHVLGSRILGFSQDLYDDSGDTTPDEVAAQVRAFEAMGTPRLAELTAAVAGHEGLGGCDDDAEFVFALDLTLEGLDRRRPLR
ncbi:TetR/AcrR family transcriptional regulator C-terminal domain-containing protein [Myceligenerans halotolerans]